MMLQRFSCNDFNYFALLKSSLLVLCWVSPVMYLCGYAASNASLAWVILCFLALFAPTTLGMLYLKTVDKIERLQSLKEGGTLLELFSSRVFTTIITVALSAITSFASVFWFYLLSEEEKIGLLSSVFFYVFVIKVVESFMASELRQFVAKKITLRLSAWLFACPMALIFYFYQLFTQESMGTFPLAERINEIYSVSTSHAHQSVLIHSLTQWAQILDATRSYSLTQLMARESWYGLIFLPVYLLLFHNFAQLISPFLIGKVELRRIAVPLTDADVPKAPSGPQIVAPSAWTTIVAMACVLSFLEAEQRARYSALVEVFPQGRRITLRLAEDIDGLLYRPGTSDTLECRKLAFFSAENEILISLKAEVTIAFARVRNNVDLFLDEYYSLSAEYMRLASLATGTLEAELRSNLMRTLTAGEPFKNVDEVMSAYLVTQKELSERWQKEQEAILAENKIEQTGAADILVIGRWQLSSLTQTPDLIGLHGRATGAGLAGTSVIVASKVLGKISGKGALKAAAQAMTKIALSKTGGTAAGAAIGATVGSVVPVFGTAIGGLVGAATGLIAGVVADATLLKLDEYYSRPQFKRIITSAIDEQENEWIQLLTRASSAQSTCSTRMEH